jgi:hypothetical protein
MAVVTTFTIGGDDMRGYVQLGTLTIDYEINSRPVMRCVLRSVDPDKISALLSYHTIHNLDVVVEVDSVRVFGGIVWTADENPVVDYRHHEYTVQCVSYAAYGDVSLFNGITAAGTLKSMLTTIAANIGHGVTLDAAQDTGPTLVDQGFPFLTVNGCFDQLATVSGWNYRYDFDKHVRFYGPGTIGAPFALQDTDGSILSMKVSRTLTGYSNYILVNFGSSGQQVVLDKFFGDGSSTTFPLHYNVAVAPTTVSLNSTNYLIDGVTWTYNAGAGTITYSGSPPGTSDTIGVPYTAQFPSSLNVTDPTEISLYDYFAVVVSYPDVYDYVQATSLGEGELARRLGVPRTLSAKTSTAGLVPGMTVNVTVSKFDMSSVDFLITKVSMQHVAKIGAGLSGSNLFFFDVSAVEGNQYRANWQQYFKNLMGGSATSGATAVSSTSATSPTSIPYAYWGGSLASGQIANATWKDVPDALPIRLDGTAGVGQTVRVLQRTGHAGTSVQARIVKRVAGVDTQMATGGTSTSTVTDEEVVTFTPSSGVHDYYLQVKGSDGNASVFAMGQSL